MERAEFVIVGAGIGGLSLALALQRLGRQVTLFEQAAAIQEVGAGVMLSPNATRVLLGLGLRDQLERVAYVPRFTSVSDGVTGRILSETPFPNAGHHADGSPFWHLHRADLHSALLTAVRKNDPECLHLGFAVRHVVEERDCVIARLSAGRDVRCEVLVGADGIKSVVRGYVNPGASARFTGNVAWRGLVPVERLRHEIRVPEGIVWVGKGRHVVRYAVRGGTLMNYVAISERASWVDEGWTVRSTVAQVITEFAGWHPNVLDIIAITPDDACFQWGLFDHDPLARWSTGRVTLLGDAAHPMLPFMAQGAAMAIEDAAVLARTLNEDSDVTTALAKYERCRLPRTSWVQAQSRRNQRLYHERSASPAFDADRALRAERLYDYDALHADLIS